MFSAAFCRFFLLFMPNFVKFIEKFLCSYARALGTQKKLGQTVVFNRFVPRVQKFLTDFNGGGLFERGAQRTNHAPFPFTCAKSDFGGWGASGFPIFYDTTIQRFCF